MKDGSLDDRWRRVALSTGGNRSDDVHRLFSNIVNEYDFLNRLLTFGFDGYLRRQAVIAAGIQKGSIVVDAGTGTGELALRAVRHVGSEGMVYGVDFCAPMLDLAREKARQRRVERQVHFAVEDVRTFSFPDGFAERVLMGFALRNVPEIETVLGEVRRILKPRGRFVCLEVFQPEGSLLSPFVRFYLHQIVPRVAGLFAPGGEYTYLPNSLTSFPSINTLLGMFEKVGFGPPFAQVFLGGTFGILCAEVTD
ncbi:MAG: ubiquinone/menaquinone biosynthesis methyltransferase [Limnochordia bacterium]